MSVCAGREKEHWQRQNAQYERSNDDDTGVPVCAWVLKLKYFSVKLYGNYDRNQWKNSQRNKEGKPCFRWNIHTKTDFTIELFCFCGFRFFSLHTLINYMLCAAAVLWFFYFFFFQFALNNEGEGGESDTLL